MDVRAGREMTQCQECAQSSRMWRGGTKEHLCKSNPMTAKKQVRKKKKILLKDEIGRLQLSAVIRGGRCFQQNSTWLNGGAEGDEGTDLLKCLIMWKEICSVSVLREKDSKQHILTKH